MISGKNKVQLVELGPGRGTLASDILRVSYLTENELGLSSFVAKSSWWQTD